MRMNLPVTDHEIELSDTSTIVSATDLQGNITYANPYFIQISGYSAQELMGAPQNILRHPDMPAEAFADFWQTIRSGRSWSGMVKNRCKNGDYYWVLANVTPVIENGSTVGYMSVRTKPNRAQVAQAITLYARMKAGKTHGIALSQGAVVRTGWLATLRRFSNMPLGRRIAWNFSFLMVALLLQLCWSTGIFPADAGIWRTGMLIVLIGTMGLFWHALHAAVLQPLQQARAACDVMAGGDLTQQDDTDRTDEMGQLLRSLRQLRVNLHSIVGDVRDNFLQISTVTREIASGNMDLSQRTDAQALALQKTASSMGQLAVTVQQNSGNADQASDMAGITRGLAGKVGENVEQVVRMMSDINASSRKIGDITGMIDAIAFQTNILALNAAVEAARAGEQGRGFAVVAGEVRSLAQRCSSAANEIKQLIAESLRQVDAGTALAGHAGNSSQEMLESVEKVYGLMSQIALASSEQSHGIGTVQQAITQMDEVTQRNAALVEQSASASAALQDQAIKLEQAMALFKLGRR